MFCPKRDKFGAGVGYDVFRLEIFPVNLCRLRNQPYRVDSDNPMLRMVEFDPCVGDALAFLSRQIGNTYAVAHARISPITIADNIPCSGIEAGAEGVCRRFPAQGNGGVYLAIPL